MACADVPLVTRVRYGILIREGFRVSELLGLTWSDVDLDRGVVVLELHPNPASSCVHRTHGPPDS